MFAACTGSAIIWRNFACWLCVLCTNVLNLSTCVLYLVLCFELGGGIVNRPRNLSGVNFRSMGCSFRWQQLSGLSNKLPNKMLSGRLCYSRSKSLWLPHLWVYIGSVFWVMLTCWIRARLPVLNIRVSRFANYVYKFLRLPVVCTFIAE